MGLKLFPAGREQPGALLHSSPMGSFPSLYTGSIISSFYALSVTQIHSPGLTISTDFLLAPWSLQREVARNRYQCSKSRFKSKEILITAMGISHG